MRKEPKKMEDSTIVSLYLSRNETAIAQTANKYGTVLHSISYTIVQNDADAEECTNDTYLKAWNSIPPNTPYTYLFAYLARIVRNLSLNLIKRNRRQKRSAVLIALSEELCECLPSADSVDTALDDNELALLLSSFLHSLPPTTRKIFIRRYWYMESIAKISRDFGFSESKVTSMLYRTRTALKNTLEKEDLL